ncbi:Suppressor of cytokine signaling 6 [Dermatophagoides farinae]|uniref:Suppressor of cytokine signaling 6 n=1 Tax=Dermatophagoides farinae TaxID=6954 RepID=A0A922L2N4_DERFA|nr:suppressor of cytokine signaling 6-like [Dermatophagoides farinae]KAH7637226.1 suppressor of cytokine signaling 7-like protein [Dermatophagoides farinae]KAH9511071.1 Suppressor of cytokine signaling 6 [Dermatophagoides farinae]
MKFLSCITSIDDNDENIVVADQSKKSQSWHETLRHLFKSNKKNRVVISDPTPLSKEKVPEVTGVVQIGPEELGEIVDKSLNNNNNNNNNGEEISTVTESVVPDKVNAETNTEQHESSQNEQQQQQNDQLVESKTLENLKNSDNNELLSYGWYWGDISRRDAENLLRGREEGIFLVRKSSNQRFLYSLSFRSNGKTLHTRIECSNGLFAFYSNDSNSCKEEIDGSESLYDLISDAMNQNNAENIFFYSRGLQNNEASLHTITLVKPLSRYQYIIDYDYLNNDNDDQHGSLQYLCKFIIHHSSIAQARFSMQRNSLPEELESFLNNGLLFPYVVQQGKKQK